MRFIVCLLASLWLIAPASAQRFSQEQFVLDIYAKYDAADKDPKVKLPDALSPSLYSKRMQGIIATMRRSCKRGDICGPGFDVFVNGQDFKITDLVVKTAGITETSATVTATFKNLGAPVHVDYLLVRQANRWAIDDLVSHKIGADGVGYTLSSLLKPSKR